MPSDSITELLKLLFYTAPKPQMPEYAKSEQRYFRDPELAILRAVTNKIYRDLGQLEYANDEERRRLDRGLGHDLRKAASRYPLPNGKAVDFLRHFMNPETFINLPTPTGAWYPYLDISEDDDKSPKDGLSM